MPFYLSDTGMAELLRNLKASSKSFMALHTCSRTVDGDSEITRI